MKNLPLSLYRKTCVYNFDVISGKVVGKKHPENRPAGLMVSALPADSQENYLPDKKVSFFCGLNDILQLGNLFKSTGPCEVKLIHKPDGNYKDPLSKVLTFTRSNPDSVSVTLNQRHANDESKTISIPGTSFDKGTLWALEILCTEAFKQACDYDYRSVREA